ncbi:hypothetical protein Dimus_013675 [Dionaea muscipula]
MQHLQARKHPRIEALSKSNMQHHISSEAHRSFKRASSTQTSHQPKQKNPSLTRKTNHPQSHPSMTPFPVIPSSPGAPPMAPLTHKISRTQSQKNLPQRS